MVNDERIINSDDAEDSIDKDRSERQFKQNLNYNIKITVTFSDAHTIVDQTRQT